MPKYRDMSKEIAEGDVRSKLRYDALRDPSGPDAAPPLYYRYVVLETIFDPAIIDAEKLEYWEHDLGVINIDHATVAPRNSIIAQRVRSATSSPTDPVMVLYPFFPPAFSFPCKPGEHVWVIFEDKAGTKADLGYWQCRIVQPNFVEDANHTHPPRRNDASFQPGTRDIFEGNDDPVYEFKNGSPAEFEGERYTAAETAVIPGGEDEYKRLMLETDGGLITHYEPVPKFRKRPADIAIEGNNNTLISLGRDRTGPVATYEPDPGAEKGQVPSIPDEIDQTVDGAGVIDIVVGRGQTVKTGGSPVDNDLPAKEVGKGRNEVEPLEGDPDLANDRSRIYVAQKTATDTNFGLTGLNSGPDVIDGSFQGNASEVTTVEDTDPGDGAIVVKSDKLRLIARSDVEILVTTFERDENDNMVAVEDPSKWAAVIIKANGDIIMRPADRGYIKLGGDDADKALLCSDTPANAAEGGVDHGPITTTGGHKVGTHVTGQGSWASKILVRG